MELEKIRKKFERMGARVKFRGALPGRSIRAPESISIDVISDRHGEYFDVLCAYKALKLEILSADPKDRHLLLLVDGRSDLDRDQKTSGNWEKFLCGHDERHWFVAGVDSRCSNMNQAKDSLKPKRVIESQARHRVKAKNRNKRRNAGFVRQGEWFFIPATGIDPARKLILHNEPIRRGFGKAHIVQYLYRHGGTVVYVNSQYPNGLTQQKYNELIKRDPAKKGLSWRVMSRDPQVYAKGRVRHPDHKTIILDRWHQVLPNREIRSQSIAFLD